MQKSLRFIYSFFFGCSDDNLQFCCNFERKFPANLYISHLTTMVGITPESALYILGEIGTDMSVWHEDASLACWAGLSPANNASAGKKKSTKVGNGGHYLKPLLVQCALAATNIIQNTRKTKGLNLNNVIAYLKEQGADESTIRLVETQCTGKETETIDTCNKSSIVQDAKEKQCTFRELKQQIGAFCYHFWSKYMPKLSYYQKKGEPALLEQVEDGHAHKKVLEAVRAIEMHMALSCIAMGLLQSLLIRFIGKISSSQLRYQRTPSKGRVSEAALMHHLRKHFFRLLGQKPELCITQIIHGLQEESEEQ